MNKTARKYIFAGLSVTTLIAVNTVILYFVTQPTLKMEPHYTVRSTTGSTTDVSGTEDSTTLATHTTHSTDKQVQGVTENPRVMYDAGFIDNDFGTTIMDDDVEQTTQVEQIQWEWETEANEGQETINYTEMPNNEPLDMEPPLIETTVANAETTVPNTELTEPTVANTETTVANTETTVANTETTVANTETTVANTETTVANTETTMANTEATVTVQVIQDSSSETTTKIDENEEIANTSPSTTEDGFNVTFTTSTETSNTPAVVVTFSSSPTSMLETTPKLLIDKMPTVLKCIRAYGNNKRKCPHGHQPYTIPPRLAEKYYNYKTTQKATTTTTTPTTIRTTKRSTTAVTTIHKVTAKTSKVASSSVTADSSAAKQVSGKTNKAPQQTKTQSRRENSKSIGRTNPHYSDSGYSKSDYLPFWVRNLTGSQHKRK